MSIEKKKGRGTVHPTLQRITARKKPSRRFVRSIVQKREEGLSGFSQENGKKGTESSDGCQ